MVSIFEFTDVINGYLPEPHASLLNGILLGIPLKTSKEFYAQLKIVGLVHIVVLSGMNITLLSAIIIGLTYRLGKLISTLITIVSIVLFIQFVGPAPPIVRAGFMGILSLIAILYGRRTIALYTLILSAILLAFYRPDWLQSISFQLSYAATLGLILFSKSHKKISNKKNGRFSSVMEYLTDELRTSLAAQAFTVPLIFFYFKQVSLISPIANIAISWTIAPIMVFGLLTLLLGKIHYLLGLLPSYVCYILLHYIIVVVELMSKIPFALVDLN